MGNRGCWWHEIIIVFEGEVPPLGTVLSDVGLTSKLFLGRTREQLPANSSVFDAVPKWFGCGSCHDGSCTARFCRASKALMQVLWYSLGKRRVVDVSTLVVGRRLAGFGYHTSRNRRPLSLVIASSASGFGTSSNRVDYHAPKTVLASAYGSAPA